MLEFAVLGLLHETPMHGYELRKRLTSLMGPLRAAISYGSLYPTLRRLEAAGFIVSDSETPTNAGDTAPLNKRSKVVYRLTDDGTSHFSELLSDAETDPLDTEKFGVRFAFFSKTDQATRIRILENRRLHMQKKRDGLMTGLNKAAKKLDAYTLELQQHGLESLDREVRWLSELIDRENSLHPLNKE